MSGGPGQRWHRRLVVCTAAATVVVLALGLVTAGRQGGLPFARQVLLERPVGDSGASASAGGSTSDEGPAEVSGHRGTVVDVPTHDLGHLPEVILVGVLHGDADADGGCLWLEMDGVLQAVRWRAGWQAHFAPPEEGGASELLDDSGQTRARGGETVYFHGARSGAAERLDRCHVGDDHVWYVGEVTTESPFD